jgi:apolipoprotein N-acyltransferase
MFKYNQIDKHLQNWAMQRIINKELRFGPLLCYEKAFGYEKTKVSNLIFF